MMSYVDLFALFVTLSGYVVGLGGVTVIEFHAWLGRHSEYWKEATTRTHKITKPLIWIGLGQVFLGSAVLYRTIGFTPLVTAQLIIGLIVAINGLYLTLKVSPLLLTQETQGHAKDLLPKSIQHIIAISFALSYIGWWSGLLLFTVYLWQK